MVSELEGSEEQDGSQRFLDNIKGVLRTVLRTTPLILSFSYIVLFRYFQENNISLVSLYSISSSTAVFATALLVLVIGAMFLLLAFIPVLLMHQLLYYPLSSKMGINSVQGIDWNKSFSRERSGNTVFLFLEYIVLVLISSLLMIFKTYITWLLICLIVSALLVWALLLWFKLCFFGKGKRLLVVLSYVFIPLVSIVCAYLFFSSGYSGWRFFIWLMLELASIMWLMSQLDYWSNRAKLGAYVIAGWAFIYLFMNPSPFTDAALKFLGIGGGVKQVYRVYEEDKSKIAFHLIDNTCCNGDICLTKELSIIWGVGDPIYVSLPENIASKQPIALAQNILLPYNLPKPIDCMNRQNSLMAKVSK